MSRPEIDLSVSVRQVLPVWGELSMYAWKSVDVVIWDITPSLDGLRSTRSTGCTRAFPSTSTAL